MLVDLLFKSSIFFINASRQCDLYKMLAYSYLKFLPGKKIKMAADKQQLVNLGPVGIVLSVLPFTAECSSALKMF